MTFSQGCVGALGVTTTSLTEPPMVVPWMQLVLCPLVATETARHEDFKEDHRTPKDQAGVPPYQASTELVQFTLPDLALILQLCRLGMPSARRGSRLSKCRLPAWKYCPPQASAKFISRRHRGQPL